MDDSRNYVKILRIKDADGSERSLQFPMQLDLERPKRPRTTFSDDQLEKLEEEFQKSGYVTGEKRAKMAERLGLSDTQVKVWFQNRRTKDRRKAEVPPKEADHPMTFVPLPPMNISDISPSTDQTTTSIAPNPNSFPSSPYPIFPIPYCQSFSHYPFHTNFPSLFHSSEYLPSFSHLPSFV